MRALLIGLFPLILSACGYGYVSFTVGDCPRRDYPAIIVDFEDRRTGQALAVDASGVLFKRGGSESLRVFEYALPAPLVYSLAADVNLEGYYRIELSVARGVDAPLLDYVYEDIYVRFDYCGPITRTIHVLLD